MKKYKPQDARHIAIDEMVRSGSYPNCTTLAEACGVSPRTIARDIEYMRDTRNAPIEFDSARNGYYYTEPLYRLPAIQIRESELFALCIAERALEQYSGTPLYGKLRSIFKKLAALLPDGISVDSSWLGADYSFLPDSTTNIDPAIWNIIALSLRCSRVLKIRHLKPSGENTERIIHPYHMLSFRGQWYLIAHCTVRNEVLRFAVSRIIAAWQPGARFQKPFGFVIKSYMGKSFGIIDEGQSFTARVYFDAKTAPYVSERSWHPMQTIEEKGDGGIIIELPASSSLEVMQWVLKWGKGARVLAPESLVSKIQDEIDSMKAAYSS